MESNNSSFSPDENRGRRARGLNIVITGASKGIGKAVAEKFADDKNGHHFFLCARNNETLQGTAKELKDRFPETSIYTQSCDIGIKSEVKKIWRLGFTTGRQS